MTERACNIPSFVRSDCGFSGLEWCKSAYLHCNTPIVLYYVAYVGLLHALFFCADHVPEVAAMVSWQGSAVVAMLSIVVMVAGTILHNGAMIAVALLFAWQAVGAPSLTLVGPLY